MYLPPHPPVLKHPQIYVLTVRWFQVLLYASTLFC
jgi:hypothetical protein